MQKLLNYVLHDASVDALIEKICRASIELLPSLMSEFLWISGIYRGEDQGIHLGLSSVRRASICVYNFELCAVEYGTFL